MSAPTFGRPVNPGTPAPSQASRPALPGILRDRRAQLGAAAAAVVVVVALARRGGDSPTGSQIAEGTSGGSSTADTTATDIEQAISGALTDVYGRLDDIASGLGTPAQQQLPANPTSTPKPAPAPTPAKPAPKPTPAPSKTPAARWYTIVRGDNLSRIASRNKTTLSKLKQLNPGLFDSRHRGGNLIHPGERVRLS